MFRTAKYIKQNALTDCTPRQYDMLMASMGIVLSYKVQAILAMEECRVILFDRYIDTFLFEFNGYGPAEKLPKTLPECDISFFLYCDVETAMKRVTQEDVKCVLISNSSNIGARSILMRF